MVEVQPVPAREYEAFVRRLGDPLILDLEGYERWRRGLGLLRVFWCSGEMRVALLGLYDGGELLGVLRVLRVPFLEARRWGGRGRERGEVQDIFLRQPSPNLMQPMIEGASRIVEEEGLSVFGVSEWKPGYWEALEALGFSPYARSVLIGWDTGRDIPREGGSQVEVRLASGRDMAALREIQKSSWGFFIRPDFGRELVLLALVGGRPVGSAYLNRFTGHVDFGVHVRREFQRRRVGTTLLRAALKLSRERGFRWMFVTRLLRALTKVNQSDRVALSFYLACGGRILREYRGFRAKRRPRPLSLPPIEMYFEGK